MLEITSGLQFLKADIEVFHNSIDFYIIKQRDEPKKKKDVFSWVKSEIFRQIFSPISFHSPFTSVAGNRIFINL